MTGFKSFATKTVLGLEPGITAVVGPNGSGKSNLADAVRWALGEQNKGRLRLGGREEVVFAGTEKRARASYAEVVLVFDNEDGAFPLDLTEVEIARRLYRSGESEYRLAGRAVALRDIQTLLAQAGFGAGSYAVIGQGMIDSFLLSSSAERKLLFDEAAGIRGPELGREAALRKLAATTANLTRLRDIAAELAPRLASLQDAVASAGQQQKLQGQVAQLRASIAATAEAHWTGVIDQATVKLQEAGTASHRLRHEITSLEREQARQQAEAAALQAKREQLQTSLADLERERDQLGLRLGQCRSDAAAAGTAASRVAEVAARLEEARAGRAAAAERQAELEAELASNATAAERALRAVERTGEEVTNVQAALVALRQSADDGTRDQYVDHALQIIKTLAQGLHDDGLPAEQVRLLVHKAGRLLSHATRTGAAELLNALQTAQKRLESAMSKRDTAVEHQTNVTITRRSLEIDLAHQAEEVRRAGQYVAGLEDELEPLQARADQLTGLERQAKAADKALAEAAARLEHHRELIRGLTATPADTGRGAQLAARYERAKAAAAALAAEKAGLERERTTAAAARDDARRQAKVWGVVPGAAAAGEHTADAGEPAVRPLEELQAELLKAEAMLEAKTATIRDQTAEYEEVRERHTDLTAQIADLESAQADLERVIAELAALIKARFKDNFQALSAQYKIYFSRLFQGGAASLELEESDDGTYGINIKASPRGKRLTSIAALSGGERALAGVALLAAILKVNPAPFVVLDEIDAALDEANSARLAAIIGELQEQSQIIVITHNHQIMKAARTLFGVTTGEHHTSHILSVRLEEAAALAAR